MTLQRGDADDGWVVLIAVANVEGDRDGGFAITDVFASSETGCRSTLRTTATFEITIEFTIE
eukprot:9271518-Lingulodinium_polyedra.AAC.1